MPRTFILCKLFMTHLQLTQHQIHMIN